MRIHSFCTIIWAALLLATGVEAQEIPRLTQYDKSVYQGAHQNWDITQDSSGYYYIANSAGVLIHNGLQWRLLPLPRNVKARSIHHYHGRIYVTGYETLGYVDMSDRQSPVFVDLLPAELRDRREDEAAELVMC